MVVVAAAGLAESGAALEMVTREVYSGRYYSDVYVTSGTNFPGAHDLMTDKSDAKPAAKGPKAKVSKDVNKSAEIRKVATAMKAAGEKPVTA